jgi:hypothetical protein
MLIDLTTLSEDELVDLNRRIVERLQLIRSAKSLTQLARFSVGMAVEFETGDGRKVSGTIARLKSTHGNGRERLGTLEGQSVAPTSLRRIARIDRLRVSCRHDAAAPSEVRVRLLTETDRRQFLFTTQSRGADQRRVLSG